MIFPCVKYITFTLHFHYIYITFTYIYILTERPVVLSNAIFNVFVSVFLCLCICICVLVVLYLCVCKLSMLARPAAVRFSKKIAMRAIGLMSRLAKTLLS